MASIGPNRPHMTHDHFYARHEQFEGWNKYNRDYWLRDYPDFAEHFIKNISTEPHSTKQIEDGIEWASNTTGPVLIKTVEARAIAPAFDVGRKMYGQIRCPVLLIHGDDDRNVPFQQTTDLVEKLRAQNVVFEELIIPDEIHDLLRWSDWVRSYKATADFFDRKLAATPQP